MLILIAAYIKKNLDVNFIYFYISKFNFASHSKTIKLILLLTKLNCNL